MGESSTSAAVCRVCGHRHWMRDPHVWGDETKKAKVAELNALVGNVATTPKKVATSDKDVATIRRVSIRELNQNISWQFSNLPFEVTKNGKVIARVTV